jgi:hypothetical protein
MFAFQHHTPSRSHGARLRALLCGVTGGGLSLLAVVPATAQTCGPLGSPNSISGCVVPGQYGTPSVRIKSDPLNPGGYRSFPVSPAPSYPSNLPPGMNRDYNRPGVPGLY